MIGPTASSTAVRDGRAPAKSELGDAARQFEAVFLRQLIGSMRRAKLAEDPFGSSATESFREMADAHTADSMARLGQFGIATMIEHQFKTKGGRS